MNKIFKVVWSKTKECYVVVSEVAKNNGGKKKALASVLAGLAMVAAAGGMGTPVQAGAIYGNSAVNISPDNVPAGYGPNKVSTNSVVVGYANDTKTSAAGNGHVAYGFNNTATEDTTTALGGGNKATGPAATAVGSFNEATARASVAMGNVAKATGEKSISIGNYSVAKSNDDIAIGNQAKTTSTGDSIAMGRQATAGNANALAFGAESNASGWGSIATGREAAASANYATAIGYKANASGSNSISIGKENTAKAFDAVAIGHNNTSRTYSAVSLGTDNTSDATYGLTDAQVAALPYDANHLTDPSKTDPRRAVTSTIAIGRNNVAGNVETIAIGTDTKATMTDAIAIGARAEATGDYALAIGGAAGGKKVSAAEYGTAVGVRANAAERASAFGAGSNAEAQKSVAIGYTAKAAEQKDSSTYSYSGTGGAVVGGVNTSTKTIHKGKGTDSTTDIYNSGEEVAIGSGATVSDESNAAVVIGKGAKTEGNAHYSVVVGKGSYANASDGVVVGQDSYVKARESVAIGQGANVSGAGNVRSQAIGFGATVTGTNAYDATAIGATAQVTDVTGGVALGSGSESARKTSDNENVGFNSKYVDGTRVRNRAYTADLTGAGNQWDDGSINTGAVSVGNDTQKRQIINVAAGNKDTDAVNVAQLKNVGVRVGADTNTATIGTNKVAADFLAYNGQLNIKGDSNRVTTVSENDANGKDANVNVKFDYDGLVKAKAGSSVTVNQKTEGGKTVFEIDAPAATGGTTSTEKVQAKADVAGSSDKNIAKVAPKAGENFGDVGATYEVNVSRNDVKDAAREAVTVNNGGTTTGGTYTADTNNPISVTATKDDNNHNTSYAVTFDGNKAAKQIPLTYKANGNGAKTVTLEKGLDFTNGTNTTAEIGNDGVVKYNLNDKVTLTDAGSVTIGDTKVNNDGLTITGGPSITKTGGINAGNQKVTNVAPGTISSTSTDAVNGSQLYDVDQKFNNTVKLTGNAGATDGQALNKTGGLSFGVVGANSGKYISTTANGSDVTVDLSTDAKKLLNNTVEVKGKNAATVTTSTETTADGGTKTIYTVDVANTGTVAKSSWNIKSSADTANGGATATGHEVAAKNIADTNNVEMVAGKNLTVKQTSDANGATVEYALAKDLKDLDSVTTGKTITKEITLKDPSGTGETVIKRDGDRITYNTPGSTTVNKVANLADEKHITATSAGNEYTVDANGNVTMTYTNGNGDLVTGEKAVIKGIAKQDLSNIDNAGKKVITGLGSIVEAGDNVTVTSTENATTGQKTYTVNAVTPAVYTTPDGEKLTKDKDGKFHKVGETAEYTGDIITSFENPKAAAGQTTKDGGMIVNNIGSAIKNQTPTMPAGQTATYLDKLKAAADDNSNVKNAAVNVSDLHNTAEALRANELHIAPTAVKANSTEAKGGALNTAGTENVYKYDAATKKVTLTYNDGNGKAVTDTKAVIDFSALNTGGTTTSTWTAKTSAENTTAGSEVGKHIGDTSQVIDNQNSVDFQAGRNMTVKQTNDGNGNTTINYALDKDLTNLDKVVVNGKDGQAGKDGVTIVGPQGATGAPGVPGTNGIDG
ncbi:ESPR-type extended signal peptide-containing protein, partial [uncultured Veillonella sp.]|uniref:ESPR-type extended signal peptide-containing protein n=1 Tax=uncultured Veillonella sp. TaxID=159268 RepID=UPI00262F0979